MESSKRIFVVMSTILFLEASAFDSNLNNQHTMATNYPNQLSQPQPVRPYTAPGVQPAGTPGLGQNQQTNYQNNNFVPNLNNRNYGAYGNYPNAGLTIGSPVTSPSGGYQSTLIGGSNTGSTFIGGGLPNFSPGLKSGPNSIGGTSGGNGPTINPNSMGSSTLINGVGGGNIPIFNLGSVGGNKPPFNPTPMGGSNFGSYLSGGNRPTFSPSSIGGISGANGPTFNPVPVGGNTFSSSLSNINRPTLNSGSIGESKSSDGFSRENRPVFNPGLIGRSKFIGGLSGGNGPALNTNSQNILFNGPNNGVGSISNTNTNRILGSTFNNGIDGLNNRYAPTSNAVSNSGYKSTLNIGESSGYGTTANGGSNNGYTSPFNAYGRYGYGPNPNVNSNTGYVPALANSNNTYESAINFVSTNVVGSNRNGSLNSAYQIGGSNLNSGPPFSAANPSSPSTTSPTQPPLTTNTQMFQNYNSFSSNSGTSGLSLPQSNSGDLTQTSDNKFKIVHLPVSTGSGTAQTIKLPILNNAKMKIVHITDLQKIPNALTGVQESDPKINNLFNLGERNTFENYNPTLAQATTPSPYNNQVVAQNGGIGNTNKNGNGAPFVYNNYDSSNNILNKALSTLTQVDSTLNDVLGKEASSSVDRSQYGSLHNNSYQYPPINGLYNYNNQPYGTIDSQAPTSATSSTTKQNERNIYDLNGGKNIDPNHWIDTLKHAELEISQVLDEYEKVKDIQGLPQQISATSTNTTSSSETGGQYGNLYNNGYHYPNTLYNYNNQPYGNSHKTALSYSNAQSSSTLGTVQQDGQKQYNIISNDNLSAIKQSNSESSKVDSVNSEKIENNQQYERGSSFAAAGGQYGGSPLYNNGKYYTGISPLQTYNQPYGYGYLAPLTSSSNSQATASATASDTVKNEQNSYENYPYPNYSTTKTTDTNGINQSPVKQFPIDQYNAPNTNSDDISQTQPVNDGTYIKPDAYQDFTYIENGIFKPFTTTEQPIEAQSNYGSNYQNFDALSSNKADGTQQSSANTTAEADDSKRNKNDENVLLNNSTDTTVSTVTASSNSGSVSSPLIPVNYLPNSYYNGYPQHHLNRGIYGQNYRYNIPNINQPQNNYNLYPQQYLQRGIYNSYPSIYRQNYGYPPHIIQPHSTDSHTGEYADSNKQTVFDNVQDDKVSPLNTNDGTQQSLSGNTIKETYSFNEYENIGATTADTSSTTEATADDSETVTTIPYQTAYNQGVYSQYRPNYGNQPYIIQSTNSPVDTIDNDGATQTQSPIDNNGALYSYHKYSPIYGQYTGNQPNNIQTTDTPNNISNLESKLDSYTTNLPSSIVDDSTTTQSPIDYTDQETHESIEYEYEYDQISTTNNTDEVKSTVATDSSTVVADSQFRNENYQNSPLNYRHDGLYPRRFGSNHPRYHRLNWKKYGYPPNFIPPQFGNHLVDNKQESEKSYSEINRVVSSDNTNVGQSAAVADSQSESDVKTINSNSGFYSNDKTNGTNEPLNNQAILNRYNNEGNSLSQQQTLTNNAYYNNANNQGIFNQYNDDNSYQPTYGNLNNNADSYPNRYNNENKTQNLATPTSAANSADSNYFDDESGESGYPWDSKHFVEIDETKQTQSTNNVQQYKVNNDKITNDDRSSSSTVMQDKVTQNQKQSSILYKTKDSEFSESDKPCNRNTADGSSYSRAINALLKILDSIEKIFSNNAQ